MRPAAAPRAPLLAGRILGLALVISGVVGACGIAVPSTPPAATEAPPDDWREHEIPTSRVALSLPPDWLALGERELSDADVRADLEADYAGSRGLFDAVDAQGSRVRLVFVGLDPGARGRPLLAPTVAVVAVEPRIPPIGLGLGADLVLDALDGALEVETEMERASADLPVGDAVTFRFDHRVVDPGGGPGFRAMLDGALVTTDASSFLVLRNEDVAGSGAFDVPALNAVLATLRVLP